MRAKYLAAAVLLAFVVIAVVVVARDVARTAETAPKSPPQRSVAAMNGPAAGPAAPLLTVPMSTASAASEEAKGADREPAQARRAHTTTTDRAVAAVAAEIPPKARAHRIVATYFHGDIRCTTCRKVEAYAKEAVESGFADAIARGEVVFRAVNVDQPENRHFIQDFQLTAKSVVVTDEVDGSVTRHVKLDEVWRLVGDHDAYMLYVQDAVRAYLEQV